MTDTYTPSLSPNETNLNISKLGIKKANTKIWQLIMLGCLAGLYIGFGGQLYLVTTSIGMGRVIGGMMFSVGLVLVVIAGAELFTGNMVIIVGAITSVLSKKNMLKNWISVYLGNFFGSIALVLLVFYAGLMGEPGAVNDLGAQAIKVAEAKLALTFSQAFIRGVLCNALVIMAIILATIAKDIISKIVCIMLPITCFVACGFEHCIANMYLIPIGQMAKGLSFWESLNIYGNLIPVTLGNIAGGLFILLFHPNRIRQLKFLYREQKTN